MITVAAPAAWSRPAVSAISLPKLRDRPRILIAGLRSRCAISRATVSSELPVVDADDLVTFPNGVEHNAEAREERIDAIGLVVHRHDDGNRHRVRPINGLPVLAHLPVISPLAPLDPL